MSDYKTYSITPPELMHMEEIEQVQRLLMHRKLTFRAWSNNSVNDHIIFEEYSKNT